MTARNVFVLNRIYIYIYACVGNIRITSFWTVHYALKMSKMLTVLWHCYYLVVTDNVSEANPSRTINDYKTSIARRGHYTSEVIKSVIIIIYDRLPNDRGRPFYQTYRPLYFLAFHRFPRPRFKYSVIVTYRLYYILYGTYARRTI